MGKRDGIGGQVEREEWVPRSDPTVISCLPPPLSSNSLRSAVWQRGAGQGLALLTSFLGWRWVSSSIHRPWLCGIVQSKGQQSRTPAGGNLTILRENQRKAHGEPGKGDDPGILVECDNYTDHLLSTLCARYCPKVLSILLHLILRQLNIVIINLPFSGKETKVCR